MDKHFCVLIIVILKFYMLDIKKQPLRAISLQLSMTTRCFIQGICLIENWQKPYTSSYIRLNVTFFLNVLYDVLYFQLFNRICFAKIYSNTSTSDKSNLSNYMVPRFRDIWSFSSNSKTHFNCLLYLAEYVIIHFVVVWCTDYCFFCTIVYWIELERCFRRK